MNIGKPAPKDLIKNINRETQIRGQGGPIYTTYYKGQKRSEIPEKERGRYEYKMDESTGEFREYDKQLGDYTYRLNQAEAAGENKSSREVKNLGDETMMEGSDFLDAYAKKRKK